MAQYDYDLFTIGAGSGGVRASRFSANFGAKVAIAEDRYLGGTCVNVGCIPKKLFVYAAHFAEDFHDAEGYGWSVGKRSFDWAKLVANKDREIARLNGIYDRLLRNPGVTILEGRAKVVDPHTVEVAGKTVTAKYILVATGGWPVVPEFRGSEHVVTSNEAFHLETLPKRIAIVGGGYIAVEFAGIFAGLGCEVTLVYRGPHLLRSFDADLGTFLAKEMQKKGIAIRLNTKVECIEKEGGEYSVQYHTGEETRADLVMYATGRAPNTKGIGLEQAGVAMRDNGAIVIDDHFKTSVESIYALGDATDRVQLTPVALKEGMAVANTLFNGTPTKVDYEGIPTAIFSQPPIGTIGLTETEARDRFGKIDVYASSFTPLKHTLTGREEKTFMKLIVRRETGVVVGCHMVGADAGEIMQGIAIAMKCGATKAQFDATIGIHPTAAEEFVTMREPLPDTPEKKAAE